MTKEVPSQYEATFARSCSLMEIRRQKLFPANPGFYLNHHKEFLRKFLAMESNQIIDLGGFIYVGPPEYSNHIQSYVKPEIQLAEEISGTKIEKFIIFAGEGSIQENDYRAIGRNDPPAAAISGALSCYINSDYIDMHGIEHPATIRTIRHEPRHVIYGLLKQSQGNPTFSLDSNSIAYEALGGPLNIDLWQDIKCNNLFINTDELELGLIDFWDWYKQHIKQNNHNEPYFLNPVTKRFYQWAIQKGDEKYWFTRVDNP